MLNFIVIAIILLSIILLSMINIVFSIKCPKCRKWFALVWQELHQRSICKYCAWLVYDKDWHPPDKGAFKTLHELAPLGFELIHESSHEFKNEDEGGKKHNYAVNRIIAQKKC